MSEILMPSCSVFADKRCHNSANALLNRPCCLDDDYDSPTSPMENSAASSSHNGGNNADATFSQKPRSLNLSSDLTPSTSTDRWMSDPTAIRPLSMVEFHSEPLSKRPRAERRRGRPRKEEISENEDMRTVAKRMYARQYRENMKSKFSEVEQNLKELEEKYATLKANHQKLESLVEQCNFCSSSWALVRSMNIDPVVLRMAYDTLSNINKAANQKSNSD